MIVAQYYVFHGNIVEPTQLLLHPGRISRASAGAVNNDEALIGDDNDAISRARPMDRTKHTFGDLLESGCCGIRFLGIRDL